MLKKCVSCNKTKDLNEFTNDRRAKDGKYSRCRVCHRIIVNNYTKFNQNKGKRRKYMLFYRSNNKLQRYYKLDRKSAWNKVYKAIKKGKIKKLSCQICHNNNAHAHHFNYKQPLKVIWLCHIHHMEIHRKEI